MGDPVRSEPTGSMGAGAEPSFGSGTASAFDDLAQLLIRATRSLPPELLQVLDLLHGLAGESRLDKSEVAKRLSLSSKVVADREMKAIRLLRRPAISEPLAEGLRGVADGLWELLAEPVDASSSILEKHAVEPSRLPGPGIVTLLVFHGSVLSWLSYFAEETEGAWYRTLHDQDRIQDLLARLERLALPARISSLSSDVDASELRLLLAVNLGRVENYDGYLADRPISSRALRVIRLHLLLCRRSSGAPAACTDLLVDYNSAYDDDELDPPLLQRLLQACPILATRVDDDHYRASPGTDQAIAESREADPIFPRPWADFSVGQFLMEILDTRGPCRRQELHGLFVERTGGHYAAPRSVEAPIHAALSGTSQIVELAPRFYGLIDQLEGLGSALPTSDLLLNKADCRSFVLGRYAGEPRSSFPFWNVSMEQKWCEWAAEIIRRGDPYADVFEKLLCSLLVIAEPEKWPIEERAKAVWCERKQTMGIFCLGAELELSLWNRAPPLQDLFDIVVDARRSGFTNFLKANELCSSPRGNARIGAVPLSILVMLGFLAPVESWQRRHEPGPDFEDRAQALLVQVSKTGFLHWGDETGRSLRRELRSAGGQERFGWVTGEMAGRISAALEGDPYTGANVEPPVAREGFEAPLQLELEW